MQNLVRSIHRKGIDVNPVSKPRLAKLHRQELADALVRTGWTLKHRFVDEHGEPYEFILEWISADEPPSVAIEGGQMIVRSSDGQILDCSSVD